MFNVVLVNNVRWLKRNTRRLNSFFSPAFAEGAKAQGEKRVEEHFGWQRWREDELWFF